MYQEAAGTRDELRQGKRTCRLLHRRGKKNLFPSKARKRGGSSLSNGQKRRKSLPPDRALFWHSEPRSKVLTPLQALCRSIWHDFDEHNWAPLVNTFAIENTEKAPKAEACEHGWPMNNQILGCFKPFSVRRTGSSTSVSPALEWSKGDALQTRRMRWRFGMHGGQTCGFSHSNVPSSTDPTVPRHQSAALA